MTDKRELFSRGELNRILIEAELQLKRLLAGDPPPMRRTTRGLGAVHRCPCHGAWSWGGRCRIKPPSGGVP